MGWSVDRNLIYEGKNTPFKVITTAANGPPSGLA